MTFNSSFVLHVHQGKHMYHCGGTVVYFSHSKIFSHPPSLPTAPQKRRPEALKERKWLYLSQWFCSYIYVVGAIGIAASKKSLVFKRFRETNGMQLRLVRAK